MLQLKAEQDGSKVRSALEKKAELYVEDPARELPDEEEGEKYAVDFLRKGYLEDEKREMEEERRAPGNTAEAWTSAPDPQQAVSTQCFHPQVSHSVSKCHVHRQERHGLSGQELDCSCAPCCSFCICGSA